MPVSICKCIKFCKDDEIRLAPLNQTDITFNEVCLLANRLFRTKFSPETYLFKYKDAEGDLVSLYDDYDLKYALSTNESLKIIVTDKYKQTLEQMPPAGLKDLQQAATEIKKSLQQVDALLGALSSNDLSQGRTPAQPQQPTPYASSQPNAAQNYGPPQSQGYPPHPLMQNAPFSAYGNY